MKKLINILAAFILVMLLATSCSKFAPLERANEGVPVLSDDGGITDPDNDEDHDADGEITDTENDEEHDRDSVNGR